ncbi:murein biosynthesis integral membrane protein MurJ [Ewingella americana]
MNLLKSLAAVSSMTMFSRVLGFARDAIVARVFGAGMVTDAFFVAFKLPNLLRRIFAEGAFSQAFVPILAEYKTQQGEEATRTFIAYVSGLLTLVLAVVTVLGMIAAPWVIYVTAPGFVDSPDKFALTSALLRITFPYILLISLASLVGAILNTWNRFSIPAFAPTFLNVSMIGFALFAAPYFHPPILALAWAVVAGGLLQLGYQLPHLKKIGMLVLPRLNLKDAGVWRVMRQMGPAILGVSVSQISLIINTIFASFLVSGSVSWMYYADRLMEFPSGVLGVALGTILLPSPGPQLLQRQPFAVQPPDGLGPASVFPACAAKLGGTGHSGETSDRGTVPIWQIHRLRCLYDPARPDCLFRRPDGVDCGKGAGSGLLFASGY